MKQVLIVLLIIPVLFCACSKDSNDNPDPITPPQNDSIYLAKVIALDTTQTIPLDTVYTNDFTFDNSHRVTSNKYIAYDNTGTITESYITTYFYNGSDSLPFKLTETDLFDVPGETVTRIFNYQPGTRKVIFDSIVYTNGNRLAINRVFSGDSFAAFSVFYTSSGQQQNDPYNVSIVKQNGNIISQRDTMSGIIKEDYSCTYDTHPNPFYNVAWYNNVQIPSIYKTAPDCFGLNNNVTEITISSGPFSGPPSFFSHYTYTWKYRADGYPTEVVMHNNGSTNPDNLNKIKFFYTN